MRDYFKIYVSIAVLFVWPCVNLSATKSTTLEDIDCSKLIYSVYDEVEGGGMSTHENKIIVLGDDLETGFTIQMVKFLEKDNFIIDFSILGANKCVREGSRIIVLFTDGSKIELSNNGDTNCKSRSMVFFGTYFHKEKELNELKSKKIKTVRVYTSSGYVDGTFSTKKQNEFLAIINCLLKEDEV